MRSSNSRKNSFSVWTPRPRLPYRTCSRRVYEDSDPSFEWVRGETLDTLLVHLPGFRREQLTVQKNPNGYISTSGERPLDGKRGSSRFSKDFQVPVNCSVNGIRAKFENEMLHIKFPKLVVAQDDVILPPLEATTPPGSAMLGGGGSSSSKGEAVVSGTRDKRRLLLMNVGVATLVLLGIGFYVMYKLTKAENR